MRRARRRGRTRTPRGSERDVSVRGRVACTVVTFCPCARPAATVAGIAASAGMRRVVTGPARSSWRLHRNDPVPRHEARTHDQIRAQRTAFGQWASTFRGTVRTRTSGGVPRRKARSGSAGAGGPLCWGGTAAPKSPMMEVNTCGRGICTVAVAASATPGRRRATLLAQQRHRQRPSRCRVTEPGTPTGGASRSLVVGGDDHQVPGLDQPRRRPVDADDPGAARTLDHVGAQAGAVVDVDDVNLLPGRRSAASMRSRSTVGDPT